MWFKAFLGHRNSQRAGQAVVRKSYELQPVRKQGDVLFHCRCATPLITIKSKEGGWGQGRHGQWKKTEEMNEIVKM